MATEKKHADTGLPIWSYKYPAWVLLPRRSHRATDEQWDSFFQSKPITCDKAKQRAADIREMFETFRKLVNRASDMLRDEVVVEEDEAVLEEYAATLHEKFMGCLEVMQSGGLFSEYHESSMHVPADVMYKSMETYLIVSAQDKLRIPRAKERFQDDLLHLRNHIVTGVFICANKKEPETGKE